MLVTVLLGPEGLKELSHGCQVNVVNNCHAMTLPYVLWNLNKQRNFL